MKNPYSEFSVILVPLLLNPFPHHNAARHKQLQTLPSFHILLYNQPLVHYQIQTFPPSTMFRSRIRIDPDPLLQELKEKCSQSELNK